MKLNVKKFIQTYIHLIDLEDWKELAQHVINELDTYSDRMRLVQVFQEAGIEPIQDIIWEFIDAETLDNIEYYKKDKQDLANAWSRFDWFYDGLTTYGMERADVLAHFIQNKKKLGLKMIPLEAKYGWYGTPDYDLGWFKKDKFDPEEF